MGISLSESNALYVNKLFDISKSSGSSITVPIRSGTMHIARAASAIKEIENHFLYGYDLG